MMLSVVDFLASLPIFPAHRGSLLPFLVVNVAVIVMLVREGVTASYAWRECEEKRREISGSRRRVL
jgi:hypothetical protein